MSVGELFIALHGCSNEYEKQAMAAYHDKETEAIVGHLPHEISLLDEPGDMTYLLVNTS